MSTQKKSLKDSDLIITKDVIVESIKHAATEHRKKGGPYTKQEHEQRYNQVYELHFEKGYSALKIAEMLGVNRNTVNSDIRYWYAQLASQIAEQDIGGILLKQIERLELQRSRLLEELDKHEKLEERVVIEKLLFEIDNRLAQIVTKIAASEKRIIDTETESDEVSENDIKEFVRDLILKNDSPSANDIYTENDIQFAFIRKTKCEMRVAKIVIRKMIKFGLCLCEDIELSFSFSSDHSQRYNLGRFAYLRDYITIDEFAKINIKRQKNQT